MHRNEESERRIGDSLDPVTIRIDNERSVIVFSIIGTRARSTIVFATNPKRRLVKASDGLASRSGECDVEALAWNHDTTRAELDCELVTGARIAIANGSGVRPNANVAKLGERRVVESGGAHEISSTEG